MGLKSLRVSLRFEVLVRTSITLDSGVGFSTNGSGFEVKGSGFRVQGLGFRARGKGKRFCGVLAVRVQELESRI